MGVFQNNLMGAAAAAASAGGGEFYDYQIANSVRMSKSAGSTLKITAGTASSEKTFTYSWWWKRYNTSDTSTNSTNVFTAGTGGGTYVFFTFTNSSEQNANFNFTGGGYGDSRLTTNMQFRDVSGWYHCVLRCDSTQSTASDRVRLYVNGEEPTYSSASVQTAVSQDEDFSFMNEDGTVQAWGGLSGVGTGSEGVDVQLADVILCDGQSYGPDSFGEFKNGVWKPIDPSGLTFGNNGYYLKFESSSDLGNDSSGNNNDLTSANLSAHDQLLDSPTFNSDSNGGNFAAYNFLTKGSYTDLSEGNLRADSNTGADASYPSGNFSMISGKWYYEQLIGNLTNSYPSTFLVACNNRAYDTNRGTFWAMRLRSDTGVAQQNSGATNVSPFGTITVDTTGVDSVGTGDIVSWYVDMDNKKAWFAKNGTIPNSGDPANGTNPQFSWTENPPGGITFMSQEYQTSYTVVNAGQDGTFAGEKTAQGNSDDTGYGNFYYDPPTGFLALCSGNLPIADEINPAETDDDYPQKLFTALAYSGDGGGSQTTGFQPDWVWVKRRDGDQSNGLWDSTRGTTKVILSNETDAEATSSGLTSFNSTGYTMGEYYNQSGNTYASWSWRANGGTTSTNSNGSTNSTVQVDPSGHFSIVKFEGQNDSWGNAETIGHGLSSAPTCMILKNYDKVDQWSVFFSEYGNATIGGSNAASNELVLNTNAALYTNQSYKGWGGVMPTSTVFTVDGNNNNGSGESIIVYCFADCEGYIKSGSYEGNGSTSGSFIYTGFKPAFLMIKRVNNSADWVIFDTKRGAYNPTSEHLSPNVGSQEYSGTSYELDILSNGFKLRDSWATINASGDDYVFLAMAHNPFKYATAR